MKAINTLIISSLLALSVNVPVSAADFGQHTAKMNQVLQSQIDRKMEQVLKLKKTVIPERMVLNTEDATDQKVSASRS